jgi:NAD(P)-dependent dehydrogenase (short-subunit alcohol dehydrogenase family)
VTSDDAGPTRLPDESRGLAPGRGRLVGRRVLVVGGGQDDHGIETPPVGNGRAISILCAREGAAVVVADRDAAAADATVDMVRADGGDATAHQADVASPAAVASMVAAAHRTLGGLDGLVYNVGIADRTRLADLAADDWDRVMAVNLRGAMLTAQAALPLLDDRSAVVLISSIAGLKPGSGLAAYDASKAAMGGLMRHVAHLGRRRGIRANVVAPGLMDTSLGRAASQGRASRDRTPVPLGRQGTGWETAYAALFLLSAESAYITGQVVAVDGGLSSIG